MPQGSSLKRKSMVRNLAAQAEPIWPEEEAIFDRHPIGGGSRLCALANAVWTAAKAR